MSDAINLTAPEHVGGGITNPDPVLVARDRGRADAVTTAQQVSDASLLMMARLDLGPARWLEVIHPTDERKIVPSPYLGISDEAHDQWAEAFWPALRAEAELVTDPMTRVWRGVKVLDDFWPEWEREIDLERLDQQSALDCIIGQLLGSFDRVDEVITDATPTGAECGFATWVTPWVGADEHTSATTIDFEVLTEAWRDVINERLGTDGSVCPCSTCNEGR